MSEKCLKVKVTLECPRFCRYRKIHQLSLSSSWSGFNFAKHCCGDHFEKPDSFHMCNMLLIVKLSSLLRSRRKICVCWLWNLMAELSGREVILPLVASLERHLTEHAEERGVIGTPHASVKNKDKRKFKHWNKVATKCINPRIGKLFQGNWKGSGSQPFLDGGQL